MRTLFEIALIGIIVWLSIKVYEPPLGEYTAALSNVQDWSLMSTPGPTSTPTPTPLPTLTVAENERIIGELTNMERTQRGLRPLVWDDMLAKIAREHSMEMALFDYQAHINRAGENPTMRGLRAGYECIRPGFTGGLAENISFWFDDDPVNHMSSWMASEGHRKNILFHAYRRIGVGMHPGHRAVYGDGYFATMVLC